MQSKTVKTFYCFIFVLAFCLAFLSVHGAEAQKRRGASQTNNRYAAIVIDADTGYVLHARHADKNLYPASLTKMMTLYLTFEAIAQGRIRKNDRLPVSAKAAAKPPSKLNLRAGSTIRVEDAILALVTKSANDVATVLAEALGGSEARFAALMTQKARQLGMRNTRFANASGLHDPAQVSTARDMARLSQALLQHYPREYRYFSTNNFQYAGTSYHNHTRLMQTYTGMDGIKTGYIFASGYNLAASARRDGRRLIGIIFGGRTPQTRNAAMGRLLDDAFARARQPAVRTQIAAAARNPQRPGHGATAGGIAELAGVATALPARPPRAVIGATPDTAVVNTNIIRAGTQTAHALPQPGFDATALVPQEQGDADTGARVLRFAPPDDTHDGANTETAQLATGGWAVQVGAFASHAAGMNALRDVHQKIPTHLTSGSRYTIAPLMTNRGMIYRARLSGIGKDSATAVCRILRGNCLILSAQ